jgi:hypothetical protein
MARGVWTALGMGRTRMRSAWMWGTSSMRLKSIDVRWMRMDEGTSGIEGGYSRKLSIRHTDVRRIDTSYRPSLWRLSRPHLLQLAQQSIPSLNHPSLSAFSLQHVFIPALERPTTVEASQKPTRRLENSQKHEQARTTKLGKWRLLWKRKKRAQRPLVRSG